MGNTTAIGSKDSVSQSNIVDVKQSPKSAEDLRTDKKSPVPTPPRKEGVKLLTADSIGTPTSAQPRSDDPYFLLSKAMYDAIINSNTGMIRGEIEIIGDPFYLATGGIGNYNPKSAGYGVTTDGSIDHNAGQVFIVINFKNPDDVLKIERMIKKMDSNALLKIAGVLTGASVPLGIGISEGIRNHADKKARESHTGQNVKQEGSQVAPLTTDPSNMSESLRDRLKDTARPKDKLTTQKYPNRN
jgi:hypothetical protein